MKLKRACQVWNCVLAALSWKGITHDLSFPSNTTPFRELKAELIHLYNWGNNQLLLMNNYLACIAVIVSGEKEHGIWERTKKRPAWGGWRKCTFVCKLEQWKMQTVHWLRTIVFSVRKQWDYHSHVLICMVKTIVRRLCFTLTDYIIIGGSTHLNASSLHVNIYLILSLVDCNVKIWLENLCPLMKVWTDIISRVHWLCK